MEQVLTTQYNLVKSSRKILLDFCETLRPGDFTKEVKNFGRSGSIRNLLVHIENTYDFWLRENVLQQKFSYSEYETIKTADEARANFERTDLLIAEFLETFRDKYEIPVKYILQKKEGTASSLKIFTHVITHEFHHKGQILSMARHLGYIPIDTDIMR